ncbi:phosphatidylinositol kinase- protein kinase tor1 [Coemansia pectinata]|uniref:Phosphatidylinositol kinase- protein kinase tor1 n=1 Tax=Coemansia pectinata TaxID=1052879 RepID=A0A9W8H0G3_9FUNG|nr:phosphatidylinositol kinase- protein kinase tor1 [Coemansia pectinata]
MHDTNGVIVNTGASGKYGNQNLPYLDLNLRLAKNVGSSDIHDLLESTAILSVLVDVDMPNEAQRTRISISYLRDHKYEFRIAASRALGACLGMMPNHDMVMRIRWLSYLYEEQQRDQGFGSVERYHAALLIRKKLIQHGGMYIQANFAPTSNLALKLKDHCDPVIHKAAISLLPVLVHYSPLADCIAPKKHIELLYARARAKLGYMHSVSITHLGGNLNQVIGMYKAFIRPTMEYALEICIPNASLVKVLERCQGNMLRAMLGVPKSTSYAAILFLCKMKTMEHRWRAKISSYIRHPQLDSDNKHILSSLLDMECVAQMNSSCLILQLCQEAYCAGPPHLITTTISEKKQACMHALKSANKSATRIA